MGGEWILGTVNILRYSAFWISAGSTLLGQRGVKAFFTICFVLSDSRGHAGSLSL